MLALSALLLAASCGGDDAPAPTPPPASPPSGESAAPPDGGAAPQPPAAGEDGAAAGDTEASLSPPPSPRGPSRPEDRPRAVALPPPSRGPSRGLAVPPPPADTSGPVIASVNGLPLYRSVFETQIAILEAKGDGEEATAEPGEDGGGLGIGEKVELLDVLVRLELAVQEAYQRGFAPQDEELDMVEARALEAGGGREALEDALREAGSNMGTFRNQLARNEALKAWRDASFLAGAVPTEQEARDYYDAHSEYMAHGDEVRALQIMIPLPVLDTPGSEQAKERARAKAKEALALARAGRNFEQLMSAYMDPLTMSAVNGGRLGWVGQTGTFPELEELALTLAPGEVGGPVETPYSLHIVKVLETRKAGTFTFQELRPEITEMLANTMIDRLVQERSAELLEAAQVTILDPELAVAWDERMRPGAAADESGSGAGDGPEAPSAPSAGDPPEAPADPGAPAGVPSEAPADHDAPAGEPSGATEDPTAPASE
jgi:parvulin-like peptidyl-prolyl isomerase